MKVEKMGGEKWKGVGVHTGGCSEVDWLLVGFDSARASAFPAGATPSTAASFLSTTATTAPSATAATPTPTSAAFPCATSAATATATATFSVCASSWSDGLQNMG